jgi:hypothetical protein
MKRYILALILPIAIVLGACSTDLDINGDRKEVTVVYGILDATSQYQYIKINRAFLGEGNALIYSQVPDSTLYPYLLTVKLEVYNSVNQKVTEYIADTVHIYKESNIFFSGYQPYYRFIIPNYNSIYGDDTMWLNSSYKYKLVIVNPVTGNICESETPMIKNFTFEKPSPYSLTISFASDIVNSIELESAVNGKLYEAKFVFTYYEIYSANPLDTIEKTNSWTIGTTIAANTTGSENLVLNYNNYDFFYLLGARLEERPDVQRYPGKVKLVITVATDEMNTYIDVNQPSNSIIQEKPSYTNISNGVGLFASKFIKTASFELNNATEVELRDGQYTKDLNFNIDPTFPY